MKKSEIQEALDALLKAKKRLAKKASALADARKDAATFAVEIEAIGTPHYKDDEALTRLTVLERKARGCASLIEELEAEANSRDAEFIELINQCGRIAANVLTPLFERRIETICAVIKPFFQSHHAALHAARQTDAAKSAHQRIVILNQLSNRSVVARPLQNSAAALEIVADIERVLEESLKKSPDLIQFFSFEAAEAASAPVEEAVAPQPPIDDEAANEPAGRPLTDAHSG